MQTISKPQQQQTKTVSQIKKVYLTLSFFILMISLWIFSDQAHP